MADFLGKCRACGNDVSNKAKFCPHCGCIVNMTFTYKTLPVILSLLVLISFLTISVILGDNSSNKKTSTVIDTRTPEQIRTEFISRCKNYNYDDINRNPNIYKDSSCVFTGKVIQVLESGSNVVFRVNVNRNKFFYYWEDTIYVDYKRTDPNESRILEGDIITIYGTLNGIKTYQSLLTEINIPWVLAKYVVAET